MAAEQLLLAAANLNHHHHHHHHHNKQQNNHHLHSHHHCPAQDEDCLKMTTTNILNDISSDDDNHHHHHHHHHHQDDRHQRASSVTSDQYSSLNLSSVGSSAHHSPIMGGQVERTNPSLNENEGHIVDKRRSQIEVVGGEFSELVIATALGKTRPDSIGPVFTSDGGAPGASSLTSNSSALSDYHGSIPCSPTESTGSPLLAKLAPQDVRPASSPSPNLDGNDDDDDGTEQRRWRPNSAINHNNNNSLHPDAHQQPHQKARSFSHSTAFSPLVKPTAAPATTNTKMTSLSKPASPGAVSNRSPVQGGNSENRRPAAADQLLRTPDSAEQRPQRRLSRIENRQSLHDLGYGRIESYFKLQRLGKGTYATVYMGRSKLSNDLVALKEILKEHDEGAPCTAIREVSLLRLLRHNNIVTLHDICHTPKKLTLVFEYVGPDLYAHMKENNHLLSIHNVRLLRGIAFCHSRQVLHRDLKPQNLLINSRGELKICDFGLARAKSIPTKSYSNEVVTLWYRPPDVLLGNTDYDQSIDMWGVGCIFYEMASGRTFFPGSSVRQQLYLIFSSLGAPSQSNWPEILTNPDYLSYSFPSFRPEKLAHRVPRLEHGAVQLLQSFLRFKPSERISADEARRDAFFACLPERVHHLNERESIFDVPGVYMTLNPGQKLNHHHHHKNHHNNDHNHHHYNQR